MFQQFTGPPGRRRVCAAQAFCPQGKTLAQGQFTCPEHVQFRRVEPPGGRRNPKQKDSLSAVLLFWSR